MSELALTEDVLTEFEKAERRYFNSAIKFCYKHRRYGFLEFEEEWSWAFMPEDYGKGTNGKYFKAHKKESEDLT